MSQQRNSSPLSRSDWWVRIVIVLGMPILAIAAWHVFLNPSWPLLWLAVATALTSRLGIRFSLPQVGLGGIGVTASDCFILLALILLDIWAAVLMAALDALVTILKIGVARLDRKLFNVAQISISTLLAGTLLQWVRPPLSVDPVVFMFLFLSAILLTGMLFFFLSAAQIALAIALASDLGVKQLLRQSLLRFSPASVLNMSAALAFSLPALLPSMVGPYLALTVGIPCLLAGILYSRRLSSSESTVTV